MARATDKESKRLLTVLYFVRTVGQAYKDLAERVRSEGVKTTLVWANHFKGPENLIPEASAVIIHRGANNSEKIANAYASFGKNVEIHFADDKGEFIDDSDPDSAADDSQSSEGAGAGEPNPGDSADETAGEGAEVKEATDAEESVQTDATVQDETAVDPSDDEAASDDGSELDTRSDEKFFEDAVEKDEESADESGAADGELQE